jgi:hypothetical protein
MNRDIFGLIIGTDIYGSLCRYTTRAAAMNFLKTLELVCTQWAQLIDSFKRKCCHYHYEEVDFNWAIFQPKTSPMWQDPKDWCEEDKRLRRYYDKMVERNKNIYITETPHF